MEAALHVGVAVTCMPPLSSSILCNSNHAPLAPEAAIFDRSLTIACIVSISRELKCESTCLLLTCYWMPGLPKRPCRLLHENPRRAQAAAGDGHAGDWCEPGWALSAVLWHVLHAGGASPLPRAL